MMRLGYKKLKNIFDRNVNFSSEVFNEQEKALIKNSSLFCFRAPSGWAETMEIK